VAASDSPLRGKRIKELDLVNGSVTAKGGASAKLDAVFAALGSGHIEEYAEWFPPGKSPESVKKLYSGASEITGGPDGKKVMFAFGAGLVEVRVHARTREIRVPRIVGAFAAGRIVNTRTARSQLWAA
jgi:xanthine dehydrogenase YagR molybdenum-binding subunit